MIDWLKYFPLELREVEKAQTPRGPSFSWARTFKFGMADSLLTFRVPRHRPINSSHSSVNVANHSNLLNYPARSFNSGVMSNDNWRQMSFFHRCWAFYGPWFSGAQTELSMSTAVISKARHQDGVSFFHPRAFEDAVADFLTSGYGHNAVGSEMLWRGPVDWMPVKTLPVFAVLLDIMPLETYRNGDRDQIFFFPITDQHIMKVSLSHHLYAMGTFEERHERFDSKPMEALAHDIINSFTLDLSPEIQAQWDRVKAECPDMSLVENFPPLKWPMEAVTEVSAEPSKIEKKR